MRDFVPGRESAHDHFFNTFDKFSAAEDTKTLRTGSIGSNVTCCAN
jgi:hypothetical protein